MICKSIAASVLILMLTISILNVSLSFANNGNFQELNDLDGDGMPNSEDPETIVSTNTTLSAGEYSFQNLLITNCSVLTLDSNLTSPGFRGVKINAGNLTVEEGSTISSDGRGYGSSSGSGCGSGGQYGGGGGGYGGQGAAGKWSSGGIAYGLVKEPIDLGSGGGMGGSCAGGSGGGAIFLNVTQVLTIEGKVTSNGNTGDAYGGWVVNYGGGGGSGGSIHIVANVFVGNGTIATNGGKGGYAPPEVGGELVAGGGAGGRIAIHYAINNYTGTISAYGNGDWFGGAGTLFFKSSDQTQGSLEIDNNGHVSPPTELSGNLEFDDMTIKNQAAFIISEGTCGATTLLVEESATVTVQPTADLTVEEISSKSSTLANYGHLSFTTVNFQGSMLINNGSLSTPHLTISNVTIENNGVFNILDNCITIEETGILQQNAALSLTNLTVRSGGTLTHKIGQKLNLTVDDFLAVERGGQINVDGKGFGSDSGSGKGTSGSLGGGGGGHGGSGGGGKWSAGGTVYGSLDEPTDLGSGGGKSDGTAPPGLAGGSGGGAIFLTVRGTMIVDGVISANGNVGEASGGWVVNYGGGGGSGGSIYIVADVLTGNGTISANGGDGGYAPPEVGGELVAGGGGGGRIAVYFADSTFNWIAEARGGAGRENGQNGAVTTSADPSTRFSLTQKTSTNLTEYETLKASEGTIENVSISGGLDGSLNFTCYDSAIVETGDFSGQGFAKGNWTATIGNLSAQGSWFVFASVDPVEGRINHKGAVTGDMTGINEGYVYESINGSGIYDLFHSVWTLSRVGTDLISTEIALNGTVLYENLTISPSTRLLVKQATMEGNAWGYYTGPLNSVVTSVTIDDENSTYYGEGFSRSSLVSRMGVAEAYTYEKTDCLKNVESQGMISGPLSGAFLSNLNSTGSTETSTGTIWRLDSGLAPRSDLKISVWGPARVSPGQTISYIIEYRNDGLKAAENTILFFALDPLIRYTSSSHSSYDDENGVVSMDIGRVNPKDRSLICVSGEASWGLSQGTSLENGAKIVAEGEEDNLFTHWRSDLQPGDIVLAKHKKSIVPGYWDHAGGVVNEYTDQNGQKHTGWFVVEALPGGVVVRDIEKWDFPKADYKEDVVVLRVDSLTIDQRKYIAEFWTAQVGKSYKNPLWPRTDQMPLLGTNVDSKSWYCSELVRAPYYNIGIEFNTAEYDPLRIAPSEIFESPYVRVVEWYNKEMFENVKLKNASLDEISSTVTTARDPNLKYGPEGYVSAGQKLDYKVEFENEGEGTAFGVYFTDTLDEDLNASTLEIGPVISMNGSIITGSGTYDQQTRTITWLVGEVGPGEGGYANYSVQVRDDLPEYTEVINYAIVYFPSVPETTRTNAIVSVVGQSNIAITNISTSESATKEGSILNVDVTVANKGYYPETLNLTLYVNTTAIQTENITLLGRNEVATVFLWNTTGFEYGNYTVSAYAWSVPGETNTTDNLLVGGQVLVSIPGDLNGDFIVDIYDAILLAGHFNQTPINPLWNANVDINSDGIVDIYDAIILANHFNQHYP